MCCAGPATVSTFPHGCIAMNLPEDSLVRTLLLVGTSTLRAGFSDSL